MRTTHKASVLAHGWTLGQDLRSLREQRGLSLRDVGAQLEGELSWQGLARIERGERIPHTSTLLALARVLKIEFTIGPDGARLGTV